RPLTNGAGIPAELPMVSCSSEATVRLPYRGLLLGSQASGIPTTTYRPMAARKQPKYLTLPGAGLTRMAYPAAHTSPETTAKTARFWVRSDRYATTRYAMAPRA